jgi:hypothetical protein
MTMAAFFSDMTGVGFMTRITATRSLGSGAATGSTRSHFDLRQFGAALLLTAATVGEDIFQHGQHVVFRSVLRGFMAIKRKQLIKLGRRVAKPFAVDDLNHPARPRALATEAVGPIRTVSIVSPSFEARIVKVIPKISSSNDGRGTQYKSATARV